MFLRNGVRGAWPHSHWEQLALEGNSEKERIRDCTLSVPALTVRGAQSRSKKSRKRSEREPGKDSAEPELEPLSHDDLRERMSKALRGLRAELARVQTGRALPSMLEGMRVRTHGQELPMEAVGNVSVLDSATLCVELFDPSAANDVVSAIERSNLALNARLAGSKGESNRVIVPVPSLTEEKRNSMQKATKDAAEKARANVRRHRSEAMNRIKGSTLPEDDARREQKQVQNVTDEHAREIEKAVDAKTSELQSA